MDFPRPLTRPGDDPYAFSFSGLKTAAARWVEKHWAQGIDLPVADGADVLTRKAYGVKTLIVVGGVAANSRVRGLAEQRCAAARVELRVPPMTLCTDNGAMIAVVGDLLVRSGAEPAPLDVSIDPSALHGARPRAAPRACGSRGGLPPPDPHAGRRVARGGGGGTPCRAGPDRRPVTCWRRSASGPARRPA